jgi:radical SAM protein with 4Fe4S-binding SPASM domain
LDSELSVDQWLDILLQIKQLNVERIVFSGGEPTLKDGFEEIVRGAHAFDLKFGVISNGYTLTDKHLQLFQTYQPFAVGISLDGIAEHHDFIRNKSLCWTKAVSTILRLKQAGIPVAVVTTINTINYHDLEDMSSILRWLNVDVWQLQLAMPLGRMNELKDQLLTQEQFIEVCRTIKVLREKYEGAIKIIAADCFGFDQDGWTRSADWPGCCAGLLALGIMANGDVLPCLSLKLPQFVVGSLRTKSLREIWEDDRLFFNRQFNQLIVTADSRCRDCSKIEDCRGGCASMSYAFNEHLHDAPFCLDRDVRNINRNQQGEQVCQQIR